ncbi:MAG: transcription-repair coupling factor, partial [Firmicutes bacterium]|nr:transcription-repair coupling factor [Bacillota bacterium]
KEIGESMSLLMEKGRALPSVFDNFHSFDDVEKKTKGLKTIDVGEIEGLTRGAEFRFRRPNIYQGPVEILLIDDLVQHLENKRELVLIVSTDERFERVLKLLREENIPVSFEYQKGKVLLLMGNLESGFESLEDNLIVITDRELFGGAKRRKKPIFTQGKVLQSIDQLQPGDYVVHINHGIGRYTGMNTLEINGTHKDYLALEYAGEGEKLYIPTEQIQLLQKYSGVSDDSPKLNKLGGGEWQKVKQRVNASVQAMAEELIELYAAREALRGHAFSPDDEFQNQFEDEFPYQETPDQNKAIADVKKDMVRPQPMERLLCGDVGFGKTEVAIRAAFKAVSDGKQVALLVPTTILGMQHYNTFKERFKNYPFNISLLSRFQSSAFNKETIKKLTTGSVDIIIGTHRLLSKDVKFKDLGLVVIDEEQRFGVGQKEKLKYLRKNVDVLTMTATPIPRTLHMALVGVRDMSLIETPPEDRYPVRTYVTEYNPETIREAILRELARKGQIYFVSNRVQGIEEIAFEVQKLAPEARIAIAHGQMDEKYLEKVMVGFLNKEFDILVCTTIIETGLDISNVNTLIVYNADQLGLSQLYQLRGRVGRTNRVAYAYFTYKPNKVLNEDAQKRLSAIRDFTELGSGIKLAMRDLEIRGAGNILGPEQHGFIAAVGFELYCQMLEEALKQRKEIGEEKIETFEPQLNITLDGYLPSLYIPNEGQKIEMYKKINAVTTKGELLEIEDELIDRYGTLPEEAENLLWFSHLKLLSYELRIEEIIEQKEVTRNRQSLVIRFREDSPLDGGRIQKAWEKYKTNIGFIHSKSPQIKVHKWDAKDWNARRNLLDLLEILKGNEKSKKTKQESEVMH